jgi:hypothetical protein
LQHIVKKFFALILSILYLTTSTGATVQLHYCMDKLIGWDLNGNNNEKCSRCGMEKSKSHKKGCCKDEQKQVKIHNDQKVTESSLNLVQFSSQVAHIPFDLFTVEGLQSIAQKFPVTHAPPRHEKVPDYLFYCIFLI